MKNKYNNLLKYIYDYSEKTQRKETINGLFCAILEPLIQNQKVEACILIRLLDNEQKETVLKRLEFSSAKIYNFGKFPKNINNCCKLNIWDETQFLIVMAGRYSACLIWDYSDSDIKDASKICLLYNSRIIADIAKLIDENSKENLKEILKKYVPDRRENSLMNQSIQKVAYLFDEKNEEYVAIQKERTSFVEDDEVLYTAKNINEKAKFIAHEIKNHLSIINLYSKIAYKRFELLIGDKENISSIQNAIKNIVNASENISYLISDLRCMSTVYKQQINLKTLVQNSVSQAIVKAKETNSQIKILTEEDTIVNTDKVKVECAILNVIFNALDAGAKNIYVETKDNSIHIKNDGKEIPKEISEKIFEENFTTKEKGNGIGLAFCKKQMNLINGDITLISSNKNLTIFEIKI